MIGIHVNKTDILGQTHTDLVSALTADRKEAGSMYGQPVNCAQVFISGPRNGTVHLDFPSMVSLSKYIKDTNLTLMVHDTYVSQPWTYGYVGATKRQILMCADMHAHGPVVHLSPETIGSSKICGQISRMLPSGKDIDVYEKEKLSAQVHTSSHAYNSHGPIFEVFARKPGNDSYDNIEKISDFCRRLHECHSGRKFGLCIDTAHIFESGIDIRQADIMHDVLNDIQDKILGEYDVRPYIHLNDSWTEYQSGNDRHESLGHGYIWGQDMQHSPHRWDSLRVLLDYIDEHKVPSILERKATDLHRDFEVLRMMK